MSGVSPRPRGGRTIPAPGTDREPPPPGYLLREIRLPQAGTAGFEPVACRLVPARNMGTRTSHPERGGVQRDVSEFSDGPLRSGRVGHPEDKVSERPALNAPEEPPVGRDDPPP